MLFENTPNSSDQCKFVFVLVLFCRTVHAASLIAGLSSSNWITCCLHSPKTARRRDRQLDVCVCVKSARDVNPKTNVVITKIYVYRSSRTPSFIFQTVIEMYFPTNDVKFNSWPWINKPPVTYIWGKCGFEWNHIELCWVLSIEAVKCHSAWLKP